jgi:hypothetical protein
MVGCSKVSNASAPFVILDLLASTVVHIEVKVPELEL